uniref:Two pore calcium channel protein 1A n=1 Tax=Solanum tuberosum TaxID=4113 RepID=M1BKD0_SOLTU
MFTRFDFLWSLNYLALILINFFEKPLWCSRHLAESCNNRDYYYLGQLPFLTGAESLIYEGVTLLLLVIHILFPISYEGFHLYWRSLLNRLKIVLLLILVADIVVYILFLADFYYLPFRIASYLRVVFFILNIRELRDSFFILAGMFRTYLNVVLVKQVAEKDRRKLRTLKKAFSLIDDSVSRYFITGLHVFNILLFLPFTHER